MTDAFLQFFSGLARHAPGNDDDTLRALRACDLPDAPNVLDMGCGTGSSALVLAENLRGTVTGVDLIAPSLRTLAERAERRGLENVQTLEANYLELDLEPESVDLIWSEGAVYAVGWEAALDAWLSLVAPGGYLVFTDCVWVTDDPPAEAVAFWNAEYPGMTNEDELVALAERRGLEVDETFEMNRAGWIDYYGPIRQRTELFGASKTSDEMAEVVESMQHEVDTFEQHGHSWNYVFFVLRKPE
jgi:serine/threonine-protein kinase HipA